MNDNSLDFTLLAVVLFLVMFGTVMVYSSSSMWSVFKYSDSFHFLKNHLIRVFIGIFLMFVLTKIDYPIYRKFSIPILLVGLGLLIYIAISDNIIRGVSRWVNIFNITLQPSELMKYSLIFYMSDAIVRKQDKLSSFINGYLPLLSILSIALVLIIYQPDIGTAAIIFMIIFTLFFAGRVKISHMLGTIIAAIPMAYIAIFYSPYKYQIRRLITYFNPDADPLGTGYQINQSLIALGSGGILGVGLGQSNQKFLFLPEPYKDFIFSIIGEEFGFIGTLIIIILFLFILWRGMKISSSAPDLYGTLLGAGITLCIVVSAFINMAVVCNLIPTTGFPLPFISYGGSALIFTLMSVGVLLNISSKCSSKKNKVKDNQKLNK